MRRSSGNPRGSVTYSMPPICLRPGVCVWPYSQALSFPWRSPGRSGKNPHRLSLSRVSRPTRSPYDAPPRFVICAAGSVLFVSRSMNSCSPSAMGTMTSVVSGCR